MFTLAKFLIIVYFCLRKWSRALAPLCFRFLLEKRKRFASYLVTRNRQFHYPMDIEATVSAFAVLVFPTRASGGWLYRLQREGGVGCSILGRAFGDAFVTIDNDIVLTLSLYYNVTPGFNK